MTVTAVSVDFDAVEQADGGESAFELVPNACAVRCTADREGSRRLAAHQLRLAHSPVLASSDPLANFKRWPSMLGSAAG